jgi:hypothetical protein
MSPEHAKLGMVARGGQICKPKKLLTLDNGTFLIERVK